MTKCKLKEEQDIATRDAIAGCLKALGWQVHVDGAGASTHTASKDYSTPNIVHLYFDAPRVLFAANYFSMGRNILESVTAKVEIKNLFKVLDEIDAVVKDSYAYKHCRLKQES